MPCSVFRSSKDDCITPSREFRKLHNNLQVKHAWIVALCLSCKKYTNYEYGTFTKVLNARNWRGGKGVQVQNWIRLAEIIVNCILWLARKCVFYWEMCVCLCMQRLRKLYESICIRLWIVVNSILLVDAYLRWL